MRLTSPALCDGGQIPKKYTCDGLGVSPPLDWADVPMRANSLALVVDDPDSPDPEDPGVPWVHWIVVDIPPSRHGLHENIGKLASGHVGVNDWHRVGWSAPCPTKGRHHYRFRLYALDRVLELARPSWTELHDAMEGHVIAEATLTGTYARRAA